MRLILDTHMILAVLGGHLLGVSPGIARIIAESDVRSFASVASLWEIAIETRLGKLDPGIPPKLLPLALDAAGIPTLPITTGHALAAIEPVPRTRDPFDRMLSARCHVEDCRLATLDRDLRDHPLAMRSEGPTVPTPRSPRTRR